MVRTDISDVLEEVTESMLMDMDRNPGGLPAMYFMGHLDDDEDEEPPRRTHKPCDINSGYCMIWTRKAMEALGGPGPGCLFAWVDDGEDGISEYEFAHSVLYYNGMYYDAECLNGEEHVIDMPFFRDLNGRDELLSLTYLPETFPIPERIM